MHTVAHDTVTRLAMMAALAGLLNASWRRCRDTHQRRRSERSATQPEKLRVWEDEGGQNQMPDSPK
jgi:hypothetical protein